MAMWFLLLQACDGAVPSVGEVDTESDADVDADTDSDADTDADTDSDPPPSTACPSGMVPIPPEAPVYCIDAFEAGIDGRLGSDDQYAPDAEPPDATAEAVRGYLPTTGVTWSQVLAVCAMTPAVDPETGEAYGLKRLATSQEWQDAGDGVIGAGGSDWPWGDERDDTRCAVVPAEGDPEYTYLQTTGSLPECVGPWGVFDQIGNAWEWTDSQIPMSIDTWSAATPMVHFEGDEVILDDTGALGTLSISIPNVTGDLRLGAGNVLQFDADSDTWVYGDNEDRGYLVTDPNGPPASSQLPIALRRLDDDGVTTRLSIRVATEADGIPFPDKRGGAYYSGQGVDLHDASYAHFYDFAGTITLRCTADPVP